MADSGRGRSARWYATIPAITGNLLLNPVIYQARHEQRRSSVLVPFVRPRGSHRLPYGPIEGHAVRARYRVAATGVQPKPQVCNGRCSAARFVVVAEMSPADDSEHECSTDHEIHPSMPSIDDLMGADQLAWLRRLFPLRLYPLLSTYLQLYCSQSLRPDPIALSTIDPFWLSFSGTLQTSLRHFPI